MNEYLKTKQRLEDAQKSLSDKQAEFEPLHQSIKAVSAQIKLLEDKIASAPVKLANNQLTTEEFLKTKSELAVLKESLISFNEAREIQAKSLEPFNNEVNRISDYLHRQKQGKIKALPDLLMANLAQDHKDAIRNVIKAFAINSDKAFSYKGSDKALFYDALGRFIASGIGLPDAQESAAFSSEMALKLLETEA